MENDPADEMSALYQSFRQALSDGSPLDEFSKDDLIDIYDYSRGIPDDYIANEVIVTGLQRFPGNRDLIKRKALYFHDLDQDGICELILTSLPEKEFVRVIASLKNELVVFGNVPDIKDVVSSYSYGSIEDGDIIYMIDIFDGIGRLDLVAESADVISERSQYPTTVFQELYLSYFEKLDMDRCRHIGQRLTEVDPFNVAAWVELAHLCFTHFKEVEAAKESVEYALAIDPEDIGARMLQAMIVFESDPVHAAEILHSMLEKYPDDAQVLYVDALIRFVKKDEPGGVESIIRSFAGFGVGQRREAIDLMLRSIKNPLDPDARVSLETVIQEDSNLNIARWVRDLASRFAYRGAYELALAGVRLRRYSPETLEDVTAFVETMYNLELFDEIVDFLNGIESDPLALHPVCAVMYAIAHYRLKHLDFIQKWIEEYLMKSGFLTPFFKSTLDERMLRKDAVRRLIMLNRLISGDPVSDFNAIDPFKIEL